MIALISSQDGSVKFSVTLIIIVVVTQCSAGVGRTGVFVTLSIVLERMRYEGVVDMFQTVKMLFTQRPAMVQTEVQNLWTPLECSVLICIKNILIDGLA